MQKKTYLLNAPAKINLGLKILNKHENGFHDLETIFLPINLYDNLKVDIIENPVNRISVKMNSIVKVKENSNLCYRAAEKFLKEFNISGSHSIKISVKKKIPIGGGLGGGSSDAAAVLMIMNQHFRKEGMLNDKESEFLLNQRLQKLALSLGSDVPFFLLNKPAFAESRGEILTSLKFNVEDVMILVVNPKTHISTAWAFKEFDKNHTAIVNEAGSFSSNKEAAINCYDRMKSKINIIEFLKSNQNLFINDFESIVFKKFPVIKSIKENLRKFGSVFASMSGSGSTVYGIFSKKNNSSAKKAKEFFKSKGHSVFTSYIVNA